MKLNMILIFLMIFISSCGKEIKSTDKKKTKKTNINKGNLLKATLSFSYTDQFQEERTFREIKIPKFLANTEYDLELFHFYVNENDADITAHGRDYRAGYKFQELKSIKELKWIDPKELIWINLESRLNFSYEGGYPGYPEMRKNYIFIEMAERHEEYDIKFAVTMSCPDGEITVSRYPKCKNNKYKLEIKIFEVTKR